MNIGGGSVSELQETRGNYRIITKRMPETQFESEGFGWDVQVIDLTKNEYVFGVVITCDQDVDEKSIEWIRILGIELAGLRIDKNDYHTGSCYCYYWTPTQKEIRWPSNAG